MQAKTADAKLFTSALGACSAGSCWAQASWSGVFFFQKKWPIASTGRTVYLPMFTMKNRAKQQKREANYTWPMRSRCPRVDQLLILVIFGDGHHWRILRDISPSALGWWPFPTIGNQWEFTPLGWLVPKLFPREIHEIESVINLLIIQQRFSRRVGGQHGCFRLPWHEMREKNKVADLSPIHFRKRSATDGTKLDLIIGETRVWRRDSGPNLQPWTVLYCT